MNLIILTGKSKLQPQKFFTSYIKKMMLSLIRERKSSLVADTEIDINYTIVGEPVNI